VRADQGFWVSVCTSITDGFDSRFSFRWYSCGEPSMPKRSCAKRAPWHRAEAGRLGSARGIHMTMCLPAKQLARQPPTVLRAAPPREHDLRKVSPPRSGESHARIGASSGHSLPSSVAGVQPPEPVYYLTSANLRRCHAATRRVIRRGVASGSTTSACVTLRIAGFEAVTFSLPGLKYPPPPTTHRLPSQTP
jgi:hypothetical protein